MFDKLKLHDKNFKNIDKIKFTGKKFKEKKYFRHTGHPGGIKETSPLNLFNRNKTEEILKLAMIETKEALDKLEEILNTKNHKEGSLRSRVGRQ